MLRLAIGAMVATLLTTPANALAQNPRAADTLSFTAVAESLTALRDLTRQVRLRQSDSAAWHRVGMLAWVLAARAQAPRPPPELDATRLGQLADSSLRIAADFAPNNVEYRLAVGRFLLAANVAITRTAARGQFDKALDAARAGGSTPIHAEAALQYGRTFWWRYDAFSHRYMQASEVTLPRSVSDALQPLASGAAALEDFARIQAISDNLGGPPLSGREIALIPPEEINKLLAGTGPDLQLTGLPQTTFKAARDLIERGAQPLPGDVSGAADFERALALFSEAYTANPGHRGAFRALAMVFADRALWARLEFFARNHLREFPADALALMTLGLASQRQEKDAAARVAFDSALRVMDPEERMRIDNWSRVLAPDRAKRLRESASENRAALSAAYWLLANPVWADSPDRTRMEFLARVAYAELRWTVEEFGLRGADSDRGDIYIRYGPPNRIAALGPTGAGAADITTFWMYDSGLLFAFSGMPTFATARIAFGDESMVEAIRNAQPARWDNVASARADSLPVQVARFRATDDSVDVIIAAQFPAPDSVRASMRVIAPVQRFFWLIDPRMATQRSSTERADVAGVYDWTHRVASKQYAYRMEPYLYRIEMYGETAARAARASGFVHPVSDDFPLSGFGISDMLLTTSAAPISTAPARWNATRMRPLAGGIDRGASVTVVWENYALPERNGQVEYDVVMTLARTSGRGPIAARIVGMLEAATQIQRASDRVVISFSRTRPHSAAFADHITMSLAETPPGEYTLTLAISDRVSSASASRTTRLIVRE